MSIINDTSVFRRNESDFLSSPVGEEIMIMDMKNGDFIGLNLIGSHVWNLLAQPCSFASIISDLMQHYDIDENTCKEQTVEYLDKMMQKNLVCMA